MKKVKLEPGEFLKAETFYSVTKLIPGHCLKNQKEQYRIIHLKKVTFSFSAPAGIPVSAFQLPFLELLYMVYSIPF